MRDLKMEGLCWQTLLEEVGSPGTLAASPAHSRCSGNVLYQNHTSHLATGEPFFTGVWETLCFLEVVYKPRH